jgi:hypothetical protein
MRAGSYWFSVTDIGPKTSPAGHAFAFFLFYSRTIMRRAFVVQLGPETKPAEGRFEGWVEEVDSCTELRFRSSEELLKFLGQRFELSVASACKARADSHEQGPPGKKTSCTERRSPGTSSAKNE